jgi:hypothetical protein
MSYAASGVWATGYSANPLPTSLVSEYSLEYSVQTAISNARDIVYVVRGVATRDQNIAFNIRNAVITGSTLSYNLRQSLANSVNLLYAILASGQVLQSTLLQFNTRASLSNPAHLTWQLRSLVDVDQTVLYRVLANAGQNGAFNYLIKGTGTADNPLIFSVLGRQVRVQALTWNLLAPTVLQQDQVLIWRILEELGRDYRDIRIITEGFQDVRVSTTPYINIYLS